MAACTSDLIGDVNMPTKPNPQNNTGLFDQFLTPEAMLTPGVAGATAMMITNALGSNFSLSRAWTALLLSFAFGLLAVVANKPVQVKILFYVLNSLVIFCVASGANNIGVKGQTLSLITEAFAQAPPPAPAVSACAEIYSLIASKLVEIDNARASGQTQNLKQLYDDLDTLTARGKTIAGCNTFGGNNSVVNNPSQITGGPNSVINNPGQIGSRPGPFFRPW
jgi:hypothetical protein